MIARIHGKVIEKSLNSAIIDVSGVGYEVLLSAGDMDRVMTGESVKLSTYFSVRENSQELYGFTEPSARKLFLNLIKVNGVGPKVGLAILDIGSPNQIASAISQGNIAFLTSASGVGRRGAEKIIVELRDKLAGSVADQKVASSGYQDAYSALITLGYSSKQASEAIAQLKPGLSTEEAIRQTLKEINQ